MSTNGIKTSFWGPHAWSFLFSTIAGSYPVRVDMANKLHIKTMKTFQTMFDALEYTLPCYYCRESYGRFIKEIPMSKYNKSRKDMMKWLYLIHDRVNKKLMKQERDCFDEEREKLKKKKINPEKLKLMIKELRASILKTKQSPTFERILTTYEKQRAGCSKTS